MSLIKFVSMSVDGGKKGVEVPDVKTVIIRGRLKNRFLNVVESLLAMDVSGYNAQLDGQESIDDEAYILFKDGGIRAKDGVAELQGVVPPTHVIRYAGSGDKFRSFYLSPTLSTYSPVYTDMRKYSHVIVDSRWYRLISIVNDLLNFEFVRLEDGNLSFSPRSDMPVSVEGQKFVYMLMAECYLTPENFKRVLLLSDIPSLDTATQLKLFQRLGVIPGFGVIFSAAGVEFTDVKEGTSISFLSV